MEQTPITETPDIEKEKEMEMPMAKRKKKLLLCSPDDDDEAWKQKEDEVYNDGLRYMTRDERIRYHTQINESDGFNVDAFHKVVDIGLIKPMRIDNTSSTTFGKIAVQHYNDNIIKQGGEGVKLEFVKPLKVMYRVVAGFIYHITFEAKDAGALDNQSRIYQAKVFDGIGVIHVSFFRLKDKPNEVFSFKRRDKPRRQEREVQKNFWIEHSADLTFEAMMLDSKASDLDKEERPEVLSLLPPYDGKTVLELGAGIGRFTGELALKAGHVLALDFIENAIKKNESTNGHHKNVKFMCDDVTSPELDITLESMDLIFSNWLLMCLSDKEVETLAEKMIKWLKVGGYIFFRESCFHQSRDFKCKYNPTHYRKPIFYSKVFKECRMRDEFGNTYELSLVGFRCIGSYVRTKKDQNQICWIWRKVQSPDDKGFQKYLDNVQYKGFGILRYERMFGKGFVSTGGIETTKEIVAKLELKPGQKVLDVGCGIGGGDFYMAQNFDAEVVGIDLSVDLISFALERAIGLKCSVEFEVADCTKKTYPDNTFDVIYSRDTILHIQDKPALFRSFSKWLKPGGKVLISDYCRSNRTPSEEFAEYIKQRGYDLHDVNAYGQMLRDAGFNEVIAEDRTDQFIRVLQHELSTIEKKKEEPLFGFSAKHYNDIIDGWTAKLNRSSTGEQRWGLFIAKKI